MQINSIINVLFNMIKSASKKQRFPAYDDWPEELKELQKQTQQQNMESNEMLQNYQSSLTDDQIKRYLKRNKLFGIYEEKTDPNVGILNKYNLMVIPRSGEMQLGHGSFSEVYEVLYKGNRAIAKITDSYKDANAYFKMKQIKGSAPKEVSKHLPVIYDVIFDNLTNTFVIIEEILEHGILPQFSQIKYNPHHKYLTNMNLKEMASNLKSNPNRLISILQRGYTANKIHDIKGLVLNNIDSWKFILVSISDRNKNYYLAREMLEKILNPHVNEEDLNYILLNNIITNISSTFPQQYIEDENWLNMDEEGEDLNSFKTALIWLKNNAGFEWHDITDQNVMIRPSTGDLVVSDVGNFIERNH